MSRRRKAAKRAHLPDARYGSPLISQLINVVMKSGKKSIAQGIVYGAIEKAVSYTHLTLPTILLV